MNCSARRTLFSAAVVAAAACLSAADAADVLYVRKGDGEASSPSTAASGPPRAHQLDASYTFEQYLAHFDKSYDDPDEYARRSAVFADNLRTILEHNAGRLTPEGDIVGGGYVMGVNRFTDVDQSAELPMGYNKLMHPSWRSQFLLGGASRVERLLGGSETESYGVSSLIESGGGGTSCVGIGAIHCDSFCLTPSISLRTHLPLNSGFVLSPTCRNRPTSKWTTCPASHRRSTGRRSTR